MGELEKNCYDCLHADVHEPFPVLMITAYCGLHKTTNSVSHAEGCLDYRLLEFRKKIRKNIEK